MIFKFIKTEDKEEVIVYGKEKTKLIKEIEKLCDEKSQILIGYNDGIIKELNYLNIECFFTYDDKVYALYDKNKYLIKKRMYELYELFSDRFIYINQGCLANIKYIDSFDASFSGSLIVIFKSGHKDYVSRRQVKNIKERLGIK